MVASIFTDFTNGWTYKYLLSFKKQLHKYDHNFMNIKNNKTENLILVDKCAGILSLVPILARI